MVEVGGFLEDGGEVWCVGSCGRGIPGGVVCADHDFVDW